MIPHSLVNYSPRLSQLITSSGFETATATATATTYDSSIDYWAYLEGRFNQKLQSNSLYRICSNASSTSISYYPYDDELANSTWTSCSDYYVKRTYQDYCIYRTRQLSPIDKLKQIIQKRQSPAIIIANSKRPISLDIDLREQRARETLLRLIGEQQFFKFMKNGFVSAYNRKSGMSYQIFPGHGITKVFQNGNLIARLCVVFNKEFPPTDSIIMRYLLALNDEKKLWDLAVHHSVKNYQDARTSPNAVDFRSLTDILKDLKKKVA